MTTINRRPTSAEVARCLRELQILWRPEKPKAAGLAPEAALEDISHRQNSTPVRAKRKGRAS